MFKTLTVISSVLIILTSFSITKLQAEPIKEISSCQSKHKKDKKSYLRCLDALDNRFERDMTAWENNLLFKLEEASSGNGRVEAIAGFKKSIRSFQNFKKVNCQWLYMAYLPDVETASAKLKECQVTMSHARIQALVEWGEQEYY